MSQLPVASLTEGTLIDLTSIEGWLGLDRNDPDDLADIMYIECLYAEVEAVIPETSECSLVHTSLGSFGLPPDLMVEVAA